MYQKILDEYAKRKGVIATRRKKYRIREGDEEKGIRVSGRNQPDHIPALELHIDGLGQTPYVKRAQFYSSTPYRCATEINPPFSGPLDIVLTISVRMDDVARGYLCAWTVD